jgi:glycerophosphoryl diester phosphodiesterase
MATPADDKPGTDPMATSERPDRPTHPYFGEGLLRFAHRGGSKRWPENTLFAFENAYALGYRWIETDVHRTKDGRIVIFHDETLGRTTDGRGRVEDHTLGELQRLDAAFRFSPDGMHHPYRGQGITVPHLEEAFALHEDLHLNLEMKGRDPRIAEALWDFIEAHGVHDRVLVASAQDALTERFREVADDRVVTSAGARGILRFWMAVRSRTHRFLNVPFQALQVPPTHERLRVVDERFIEAAHQHGLKVHVWTIDDPLEMRRLHRLGVDGIMTDRPEVLLHTLDGV